MPGFGPVQQSMLPRQIGGAGSTPNLHPMDYAALLTAGIPGVGDVAGLAADARMFMQEPESRTPANFGLSALGALPFIPAAGIIRHGVGRADIPPPSIEDLETATIDLASGTASTQPGGMHFQTNQELQGAVPGLKRVESGFYSPSTDQFYSRELSDIAAGFPPKAVSPDITPPGQMGFDETGMQGLGSQTLKQLREEIAAPLMAPRAAPGSLEELEQLAKIVPPDIPVGPVVDYRQMLRDQGIVTLEDLELERNLPELGPRPGGWK